jgi:hypothetical protein
MVLDCATEGLGSPPPAHHSEHRPQAGGTGLGEAEGQVNRSAARLIGPATGALRAHGAGACKPKDLRVRDVVGFRGRREATAVPTPRGGDGSTWTIQEV